MAGTVWTNVGRDVSGKVPGVWPVSAYLEHGRTYYFELFAVRDHGLLKSVLSSFAWYNPNLTIFRSPSDGLPAPLFAPNPFIEPNLPPLLAAPDVVYGTATWSKPSGTYELYGDNPVFSSLANCVQLFSSDIIRPSIPTIPAETRPDHNVISDALAQAVRQYTSSLSPKDSSEEDNSGLVLLGLGLLGLGAYFFMRNPKKKPF